MDLLGSGTQGDPFRGLQAVCDAAVPGAIIDVAAGVYDAIRAGQVPANINDPYVNDGRPDGGTFEYGQPLPQYGPRGGQHNPGEDTDGGPTDRSGDSGNTGGSSSADGGCFIRFSKMEL